MSLVSFTKKLGSEKIPHTVIKNQYFLSTLQLRSKLQPFSVGTFLGEDVKGRFVPSAACVDIVAQSSDQKVWVDAKSEWLFLCGRDVFIESITHTNVELEEGATVLVQNEHDENLGYGIILPQKDKKGKRKEGELILKNKLDKGRYLRMER